MAYRSRPVVLFEGGAIPDSLGRRAAKLEVELCPNVEFLTLSGPALLVGPIDYMDAGFAPGRSGFVEYLPSDMICPLSQNLVDVAAAGGLCLSASTAALMNQDAAQGFCAALAQRFPDIADKMVELAVCEAIGNAVIHGNLGLKSDLRHSRDGLVEFNACIVERLADPTLAARRVEVTVTALAGGGGEIIVKDDGDGFDFDKEMAKPLDAAAKSGRGLGLIRKISSAVFGRDGGRTLIMQFRPD